MTITASGFVTVSAKCDICRREYPLYTFDVTKQDRIAHDTVSSIRRLSDGKRDICALCYTDDLGPSRIFFYDVQAWNVRLQAICETPVSIKEAF